MIFHLVQFVLLLIAGSGVWLFLSYFANYVINWHITHYPQWSGMAQVGFLIAIVDWGLLILLLLPAIIYLITNTRRPQT